jgi:hypothetical protein
MAIHIEDTDMGPFHQLRISSSLSHVGTEASSLVRPRPLVMMARIYTAFNLSYHSRAIVTYIS